MANQIVLISEDTDFFDYIITKLELRKTDELFTFSFDNILENLHHITTSMVIINSESSNEKTLELLKLLKGTPTIVCTFNNDNETFRKQCFRAGAFDFISLLISDSEFRARTLPALTIADLLKKNNKYREILVQKNILAKNNEVYVNYETILDHNLSLIKDKSIKAVFGAISPNEKSKFLMQPNQIETIILNNIRINDILMSYAPNKYFIILFDTDLKSAEKLWNKITNQFPEKIYAGFSQITNQNRQQLINEVLNKLHLSINNARDCSEMDSTNLNTLKLKEDKNNYNNFKAFKQNFEKKFENVISPVFYLIQQKYTDKFTGINIQHQVKDGIGVFIIKNSSSICTFKVTSSGFSKINIDITFQKSLNNIDAKRINLDVEELETGILEDLLEQFINEYKTEFDNY